MTDLDYDRDTQIDPDALDIEWLRQPDLFMQYAREAKKARGRAADEHESVKVLAAEIKQEIMANPEEYFEEGLKVSDKKIEAHVLTDKRYRRALKKAREADAEADLLDIAVEGMRQKKTALQELVKLIGLEYNAPPKEPRNLKQEWTKRAQERRSERNLDRMAEKVLEEEATTNKKKSKRTKGRNK